MKNMKVAVKLLVGFMIVTLLSVVLAGVGIFSSTSINGDYEYLMTNPVGRERNLRDMQFQFTMLRYRAANFAMEAGNNAIITDTLTPQFEEAYSAFSEALETYRLSNLNDARRDETTRQHYTEVAANIKSLADQFQQSALVIREIALTGDGAGATTYLRDIIPLTNEVTALLDELNLVAVETAQSTAEAANATAEMFTYILIGVTAVSVAISILLALYISRLISKPLIVLTAFMKKASSTGDIALTDEDYTIINNYGKVRDETGQTIAATADFILRIIEVSKNLATVAGGDLTADIAPLSDKDVLGLSLQKMTGNLNTMFEEINTASSQVSTGSHQVADGAQALAAGSTEQAASVQELSSSIAEVAERTRENSSKAEQAAKLADTIKSSAETGSGQMNDMMKSVRDINEASQSISKVIKTIDDIAFQTNILALNAAVEAARAGQHGKGFAVVAEEVRNLSAKSAQAAKDTETLIEDSMQKAEQGVRIAGETASSLSSIVSGINESNALITEIARASEEQSMSISQINTGIDQVAKVVQQNSATAEESAAASEEMSSQSAVLQELISQFKLKNDAQRRIGPGGSAPKRIAAAEESYSNKDGGSYGKY